MICALVLDLGPELGFSVHRQVGGRALAVYPLMAAKASRSVARTFLMTDSQEVKDRALRFQPIILDHPGPAGTDLIELLRHSAQAVAKEATVEGGALRLLALMFAHAPCVTGELIDEGVAALEADARADSALTVSRYDHFHPGQTRRIAADGSLHPLASAWQAEGEAWFPDWGLFVLRPRCWEEPPPAGAPPKTPWLGRRALAIRSWGGLPIVADWQIPAAVEWLARHGIADASTLEPLPQPKVQPAPKADRR